MREINIANTIIRKRKEKGITQEDLAFYMGVSKASVSKWETGQSYPDITFLPQLASYFNISVDELINYSPQMEKGDIRILYHRLSNDFNQKPFQEVYAECQRIIKKYYSCFPLLLQMVVLLVNHYMLASEKALQDEVIQGIMNLCVRIKVEGGDAYISEQANAIHATCLLLQNKPSEVVELLDYNDTNGICSSDSILANAYMAMGDLAHAKKTLQIGIYSRMLSILNVVPQLLLIYAEEPEKADEIMNRMFDFAELFKVERLHPNTMLLLCLAASQNFVIRGKTEEALLYLKKYADICCTLDYPITLHGDSFFDSIETWFENFELGTSAPRGEKIIKESMLQAVAENPIFNGLKDSPRYQSIIEQLKYNM